MHIHKTATILFQVFVRYGNRDKELLLAYVALKEYLTVTLLIDYQRLRWFLSLIIKDYVGFYLLVQLIFNGKTRSDTTLFLISDEKEKK